MSKNDLTTSDVNYQETMSSTQLSTMLGKDKSYVNRDIKNMFQSKIDDAVIASLIDTRGYVIEYYLPELESKMFVAKKDIDYLEKVVQFWIDKNKPQIPANFSEALQLAADQAKQLELQAPKVEYVEKFMETSGLFTLTAISKKLKIKRKDLIECLVRDKALFRRSKRLEPYTEKVNQGLFEIKAGEKNGHSYLQIYVTPKGCQWIAETYISELG